MTWQEHLTSMLPKDLVDAGFTLEEDEDTLIAKQDGVETARYSSCGPALEQLVTDLRQLLGSKPTPPEESSVTLKMRDGTVVTYQHYILVGVEEQQALGGLSIAGVSKHLSYNLPPTVVAFMLSALIDLVNHVRTSLKKADEEANPPTAG